MKLKVVVHEAEEGGSRAKVPGIPGCAMQGETFAELLRNLYEAVESCLSGQRAGGSMRVIFGRGGRRFGVRHGACGAARVRIRFSHQAGECR